MVSHKSGTQRQRFTDFQIAQLVKLVHVFAGVYVYVGLSSPAAL